MSLRSRLGLLALLTATLAACTSHVEGNGVYAERVFSAASGLAPFERAVIGFPGNVDVSGQPLSASAYVDGQAARQVVLSGDENLIEHFKIEVDGGGALRTSTDLDGYTAVHPPQLRINTPALVSVESIGGAAVAVQGAATGGFAVTAGSGGRMTLVGAGGAELAVVLSGGAQLDATAYPATSVQVALTGGSGAKVWPTGQLAGSAEGASAVLVKGTIGCAEVVLGAGSTCGPL